MSLIFVSTSLRRFSLLSAIFALALSSLSACATTGDTEATLASATLVGQEGAGAAETDGDDHGTDTPSITGLEAITLIHGDAGIWAVAGYRMGAYALQTLDLPHGSFDLEVVHHTPPSVQFSCIADGAAAATGASVGKLNLSLASATAEETRTTYRRRSTGQTVTLRATEAFAARYLNVERSRLVEVGRQVFELPDEEIFEVVQ